MSSHSGSGGVGVPFGFCNICGGRQHYAQGCPSLSSYITGPLCFRCGRQGHFLSQCRGQLAMSCNTCRGVGHNACRQVVVDSFTEYKVFNGSHCYWCHGAGHYVRWCSSNSTTGDPLCYKCGSDTHSESTCNSQIDAPKCAKCRGVGHLESNCSNFAYYVLQMCDNCGEEGHVDRDCTNKPEGQYPAWVGYSACATCGQKGHFMGACPTYIGR